MRAMLTPCAGFVQQGLYLRPGYYLLAPEGLQAAGQATLPPSHSAPRQGKLPGSRVSWQQILTRDVFSLVPAGGGERGRGRVTDLATHRAMYTCTDCLSVF